MILIYLFFAGCGCNLSGIKGSTATCDESGACTCVCDCDASLGYSGGDSGNCDDCLDGWYWTEDDTSCTSKLSLPLEFFMW